MAVVRQFGGERRAYRLFFLVAEWLSNMVHRLSFAVRRVIA